MVMRFRFKLFFIMIGFALFMSFAITTFDHMRISEEAMKHNDFQIRQTEVAVTSSLEAIDKAYLLFDNEISKEMEAHSHYLLDLYKENPVFDEWDFQELKSMLGMDVYILNEKNQITHTSYTEDVGLDFSLCCEDFSALLDERREAGEFISDGMDLQQKTGELKKFSYMPTPDGKYIIELGYDLSDDEIFNKFNFLKEIEELEARFPSINEINVFNLDGYTLGEVTDENTFSSAREKAFEEAVTSDKTVELKDDWNGEGAIYRYVNYTADNRQGLSTSRVVEISYNQHQLEAVQ
ncbi:hypothetical protein [Virgibacillus kimchii]